MALIISFVILFVVLGVGLSFFGSTTSNMSDRNPRDRYSNDLTRDRHKTRVNNAMNRMNYIDETIHKQDASPHTTSRQTPSPNLKSTKKDNADDLFKKYDDFFEKDDDPFKT
ncbi:MAG: hypothetical protein ACOC1L_01020 [Bacillota bacterium]